MATSILQDLKGLRVQVIHPPDAAGLALVEHLRRIGCSCETTWPLPDAINPSAVVVLVSIEQENRDKILSLFRPVEPSDPALIAVVTYEDPSTLQVVLECGALAVIERPIRPFGLLTNLTIARALWLERQNASKRIRKLERKLAGNNRILRAKNILMETQGLSEQDAYENIRRQAMAKRVPMDDLASAIINAHELLTFKDMRD
ncbi:ANTAR domain-containing protein (plasmid) [Aminobacter sp. NyZ550]|uniref:Aliphatic amidase regulator (AmiR) n=2 Tax=Aminobacter TaxID=31988 RepID=A0AAC8YTY9_AMIAI|nr:MULTISPECIES: ANTAR domain-containing protein [Aminobacter]AMS44500.1 Putative aliphatic amidase regulator (AmiR) [Aminobacter aminovorans]MBA8907751.1 AmiR/NasT family two-component response regulator [Aminobacter ciceronei]MBA9021400.1 AmiR/NasT family two-component response regulator [Aminobacter ciceronei]MRX32532.1 ANTAR domain-containing protein [Aminobacter sp. MDW-2]QNH37653.1 ANTAR domain-containing protein [Aminobacter sp. MDW-2]